MEPNIYAKPYKAESNARKNEFSLITYLNEPNTYSVVYTKRLININENKEGFIREKDKLHKIRVRRSGTKSEMEMLAKKTEEFSDYQMNTEVESDTDEWRTRKQATTNKNQQETDLFDKLLDDLCPYDLADKPTYTTLTSCPLEEVPATGGFDDLSSDESNDSDEDFRKDDNDDNQINIDGQENLNKTVNSTNSVIGLNLTSTSTRKKRSSTTTNRRQSIKRVCTTNISSPTTNENQSTTFSLSSSSTFNELNNSISQLRKQIVGISQLLDQQTRTLNEVLNNQKKLAKAMRHHHIPVLLADEALNCSSIDPANAESVICKEANGEEIDLLKLPMNKAKPNEFVLACVSKLFKIEEILEMNARDLGTDPRVLNIRKAVQIKYGLTNDQTETVWGPMLQSIKSRRRNSKAKVLKENNNINNNNNNNNDNNNNGDSGLENQQA